ncbi:hypothetical protein ACVWYH_003090 [Bradyrhizobium sp. GM24.11]
MRQHLHPGSYSFGESPRFKRTWCIIMQADLERAILALNDDGADPVLRTPGNVLIGLMGIDAGFVAKPLEFIGNT